MIDDNLKWYSHIKNIQAKISRDLGLLKYAKRYVALSTLKNMYKGIVEPHLNNCCTVWGSCGTKLIKFQKLQIRAARIVKNSTLDSSATPLIQELEWPSIRKIIHRGASIPIYFTSFRTSS